MNFFAHAVLAGRIRAESGHVFGAMLPDLAQMAGGRVEGSRLDSVTEGARVHREMDAVFHALPAFRGLCREGARLLRAAGVRRGISLGVAHVSIELTLDGWLAEIGGVPDFYREALTAGTDLAHEVVWRGDMKGPRLAEVCRRVGEAPIPERYRDPDFVATRTVRALAARPRLALSRDEEIALAKVIRTHRASVREAAPALLAAVAQA